MLDEGRTPTEVAEALGVTPKSVHEWKKAHRRRGEAGLAPKPHPGPEPRLDARQKRKLVKQMLKGPKAHGFDTELWTTHRVTRLIKRLFGVAYHNDHVGRIMGELGLSCQMPAMRAVERDEPRIADWIEVRWPRIKKK